MKNRLSPPFAIVIGLASALSHAQGMNAPAPAPGAGPLPTSLGALSRKATPVKEAATPTANEFFKNSRRFNRSLFSHIAS